MLVSGRVPKITEDFKGGTFSKAQNEHFNCVLLLHPSNPAYCVMLYLFLTTFY